VTTNFFGYNGNYIISDSILPGKAYWIKVNQNGKLILSSSGNIPAANRIKIVPTSEIPPSLPDHDILEVRGIPKEFALEQNYPNPFNPVTVVRYQLPAASTVRLTIINLLGQEVAILFDGMQDAGYKSVEWDASNVPSGMYFYRINAGTFSETKKLMLIK